MTHSDHAGTEVPPKVTGGLLLCGATIVLMFSLLTLGRASEWFDYVSGVIFLSLASVLAYRGLQSLPKRWYAVKK